MVAAHAMQRRRVRLMVAAHAMQRRRVRLMVAAHAMQRRRVRRNRVIAGWRASARSCLSVGGGAERPAIRWAIRCWRSGQRHGPDEQQCGAEGGKISEGLAFNRGYHDPARGTGRAVAQV